MVPAESEKPRPHAVMIPYPAQGHVTPMLQLAKLLHARGFHVTFVNNEFNHRRHLRARGTSALDGVPRFRFTAIDDGLPCSDADATQDVPALCRSTMTTCLPRFKGLITRLDAEADVNGFPPVTCVVGDSIMTFALRAARELGLRCATFWTASACGFLGYYHYRHLVERGLVPLKVEAHLVDGYLDATVVDWVPGGPEDGLRLRDFPSFVRTTDPDDIMLNFFIHETAAMPQASAVVINTFDELDAPQLDAMARLLDLPLYTVGPLTLTVRNNVPHDSPVAGVASNLWKEQDAPLRWLDGRAPRSVVYVNFGSITVMSSEELAEFAWGLANTGYDFLWNVRPDLVKKSGGGEGDHAAAAALPAGFTAATEGRSMLSTWCPQEAVLAHEAVGVFLTHSGWNSTLESICGGVPMVCWPFFAEQQTNCRYKRTEWGIGLEIPDQVRRTEVEALIREAMEGDKGKEMQRRVADLRDGALATARPGGRSMRNVDKLIQEVLLA